MLGRSADFQSAVSPICNRQRVRYSKGARVLRRSAECNSAIRQIENLRYFLLDAELTIHNRIESYGINVAGRIKLNRDTIVHDWLSLPETPTP
jgi:hypothetical protein